ncbi:MAG: FkbM family methyltransferase [Lachnospiraceae bacterium]|nr:FkbM family methyltransferase [Lachnospiraceae bacterium]
MKRTELFCKEIKESKIPTFIWGAQLMASLIEKRLVADKIEIDGFVVDDSYAKIPGRGYFARSEVLAIHKEYNIICGHIETFYKSEAELKNHWPGCRRFYFFPDIFEVTATESISEEFFAQNKENFKMVYHTLYDELSRKSLKAFLNEKLFGDYKPILPYIITPQYFFEDSPWKYTDNEVLFDCGAYDGDSIRDFINIVGVYEKVIACEPDQNNYNCLLENIKQNHWESIITYQMGISEKRGDVKFQPSGDVFSKIDEKGEEKILVDTIDNLSKGKRVTIIKMDIEGFEMAALYGAENTIKKYRPLLMISAYHKRDDIYHIFQFINSKVKDYVYFFRCHRPHPIDTVLYAIPCERMK